jgi:NADPH-dependent glutamate synthase beta subunit-like oxidoreductase
MLHLAIIGSGPAGYYTAEAALKRWGDDVHVDIFDLQPVPFGLIRSGVAPDHQSIKGVAKRYDAVAQAPNVRFIGKVAVGRDISIDKTFMMPWSGHRRPGGPRIEHSRRRPWQCIWQRGLCRMV